MLLKITSERSLPLLNGLNASDGFSLLTIMPCENLHVQFGSNGGLQPLSEQFGLPCLQTKRKKLSFCKPFDATIARF